MFDSFVKQMIGSLVRHALGAASGLLMGAGIASDVVVPFINASEQLVIGAVGVAVAYGLSLLEKKRRE